MFNVAMSSVVMYHSNIMSAHRWTCRPSCTKRLSTWPARKATWRWHVHCCPPGRRWTCRKGAPARVSSKAAYGHHPHALISRGAWRRPLHTPHKVPRPPADAPHAAPYLPSRTPGSCSSCVHTCMTRAARAMRHGFGPCWLLASGWTRPSGWPAQSLGTLTCT